MGDDNDLDDLDDFRADFGTGGASGLGSGLGGLDGFSRPAANNNLKK
jgi:hypothetical protein